MSSIISFISCFHDWIAHFNKLFCENWNFNFFSVLIQTFKQLTIYNRSLCTNWWHCIQGGTADNIIRTKSETKLGCCRVPFRNLKPRHCSLCRWQFKVFKVFHSRAQHTESERTAVKALRSAAEWWKEKYYDVIVSVNVCINNV